MCQSKAELRKRLLSLRRSVVAADTRAAGEAISRHLAELPELAGCQAICGYVATPGEPDPSAFVALALGRGLRVAMPVYNPAIAGYVLAEIRDPATDLAPGAFGIPEPLPGLPRLSDEERCANDVLWVVPGVAFTVGGDRLGRGGGYYDRLLSGVRGVLVGICHDWQLVERVPREAHDVRMNVIVTEKRVTRCSTVIGCGPAAGTER